MKVHKRHSRTKPAWYTAAASLFVALFAARGSVGA